MTIIGGGMVGAEVADALRVKGCSINLLEMRADIATGMARNNRYELIERLHDDGVRVVTNCRITDLEGSRISFQVKGQDAQDIDIGELLVFATGPRPNRDVLKAVQATGIPYEQIGDCNAPGDFLSVLRDAWMVALSVDAYAGRDMPKRAEMLANQ